MAKAEALSPAARFARTLVKVRSLNPFSLTHAYQREIFLVAAVGLAAFHWTALASFSPLDASAVSAARPPLPPLNLGGQLGAKLSGAALFGFGFVAWLLPLPLLGSAALVLVRQRDAMAKTRLLGWMLALGALAVAAAWKLPEVAIDGYLLPSGGLVGSTGAEALHKSLGRIGAVIAVGTLALCAGLMILRQSLLEPFARKMAPKLAEWRNAFADWKEKRAVRADERESEANENVRPEVMAVAAPVLEVVQESRDEPAVMAEPRMDEPRMDDLADEPEEPWDDRPGAPIASTPYTPPPLSVFRKSDPNQALALNVKELESTGQLLVKTFEDFGVHGKIVGYQPGPVVTVFEYQPDAGVKQSKVLGLIDDVALALKVDSIFIHPVRGKSALGVQVPNAKREQVHLGDIVGTSSFKDAESPLTFGMGKSLSGQPICADLAAMPHLLAAGATGSGKSVAINTLLCSVIMKSKPDDVRMILVDPKMLELSVYEGIPHLLMPVITEPAKASLALKWATHEMERRYRLMQLASVRNIAGFNSYWTKSSEGRRDQLREAAGDPGITRLPYILLVIDELADLMMTAPKDVESSIQRLAQKARASGIHMVLATQRPSVDVITGVIKANLPCRIAFQVVSKHDSRTILDGIGAEKLLGKGDMLLQRPGAGRLERIQGALITDEEVLEMVASVKTVGGARYDESIIGWIDDEFARQKDGDGGGVEMVAMDDDPKWDEALNIARTHGVVSASFLQRHLKIGYNRAARIVEFMESKGLVDKADGAKPRKWLGNV